MQTTVQRLGWFEQEWDVTLPDNFADDYELQPFGVRHYKENVDLNYGRIPDERTDLWLKRRNYLINCMRLVDAEFNRMVDALDRLNLWKNTVVIFTGDHGEMNGAHRMTQKGAIPFDEAAVVNLTVCAPGGPQGQRTAAVGSHLDLAPTLLAFAGLDDEEIRKRYPHLKGRSLKSAITDPSAGRSARQRERSRRRRAHLLGRAQHARQGLVPHRRAQGAQRLQPRVLRGGNREAEKLREAGQKYGAPDFKKRTFFRAVVDGRYKLVRWFSPEEYGNPSTLDELLATSDVALYDLVKDPGELGESGASRPSRPRPGAGRAHAAEAACTRAARDRRRPVSVRPRPVRHARGEIPTRCWSALRARTAGPESEWVIDFNSAFEHRLWRMSPVPYESEFAVSLVHAGDAD